VVYLGSLPACGYHLVVGLSLFLLASKYEKQ